MNATNTWFYVVTDKGALLATKREFIDLPDQTNTHVAALDSLHASYALASRHPLTTLDIAAAMTGALHYWANTQTSTIPTPPGKIAHHVVFMGGVGKQDVVGLPAIVFGARDERIEAQPLMDLLMARLATRSFRDAAGRDYDKVSAGLRRTIQQGAMAYLHPHAIH